MALGFTLLKKIIRGKKTDLNRLGNLGESETGLEWLRLPR